MYPLYKILWMREEAPELFSRAARFATAKDFVLAQLCGEWLLDYSLGAGHGLMDTRALAWDAEALELAGLRAGQLPALGSLGTKAQATAEIGAAPVLGLMDEPFRGTNSQDQTAASLAVVQQLLASHREWQGYDFFGRLGRVSRMLKKSANREAVSKVKSRSPRANRSGRNCWCLA